VVFPVGILAALLLGLGYVLQQRVAATMPLSEVLHLKLLLDLMHRKMWWAGIGCMVAGQGLAGWALQLAPVSVVEPLLSTNLLFALAAAALIARHRPRLAELGGAALLSAALGVFIAVGNPHTGNWHGTPLWAGGLAISAVVAVVSICTRIGQEFGERENRVAEAITLASAAGILYGLQDAATRIAFLELHHGGVVGLIRHLWPYALVIAAAVGIMISLSAFKAARLDWSLPPITLAEPVVGIALGVGLIGDRVSLSVAGLAIEALCLVFMIAGVVVIGRSTILATITECDEQEPEAA
jgi:drug/metabolite transporter (DMT)-like permease